VYGAPPSKKQAAARQAHLAAGKKLNGAYEAKQIRSVGLLRFLRNLNAHRVQQVEAGRFESEEALVEYLLQPFPWLLAAVYAIDERQRMSSHFAEVVEASSPNGMQVVVAESLQPSQEDVTCARADLVANPMGSRFSTRFGSPV
jgi:hypothetical protein